MSDVIVGGGGVIGLTIAWELASAGLKVCVLEQSQFGREASWAGAGMIPPGDLLHPATHQLAVLSTQLWPEISAVLRQQTGLSNGYRRCGGLLLEDRRSVPEIAAAWQERHIFAEVLDTRRIQEREPAFSAATETAVWLPDMAQVRNPRHMKALQAACIQLGVELRPEEKVVRWERGRNNTIAAIVTERNRFSAAEYVVAAGAWSARLLALLNIHLPIEPVHGQMLLFHAEAPLFQHVIEQGSRYLVPRDDGRILVGATEERIGFEKRNTSETTTQLREFAISRIPALTNVPLEQQWSGFRPGCDLGHPVLGRSAEIDNLLIAAGHFRAGLSNSPGTALLMRQLILGEPTTIDLAGFQS